jgi:hypothetical protein
MMRNRHERKARSTVLARSWCDRHSRHQERLRAGLQRAKREGKRLGRPAALAGGMSVRTARREPRTMQGELQ